MDARIIIGIIEVVIGFSITLVSIPLFWIRKKVEDQEDDIGVSRDFFAKSIGGYILAGLGIVGCGFSLIVGYDILYLPSFMLIAASSILLIPVVKVIQKSKAKRNLTIKD